MRLRPDLGETHLALAEYYSSSAFSPAGGTSGGVQSGSFDRAREELAIARLKLPNNARPIFLTAWLDRRQNRWDSALANFQKAHELDPRDSAHASYLGITYFELRRYKELEQFMKNVLTTAYLRVRGHSFG